MYIVYSKSVSSISTSSSNSIGAPQSGQNSTSDSSKSECAIISNSFSHESHSKIVFLFIKVQILGMCFR